MSTNDIRALSILIFIVSLLGENCNFDDLRKENPGTWLRMVINRVSSHPSQNLLEKSISFLRSVYPILGTCHTNPTTRGQSSNISTTASYNSTRNMTLQLFKDAFYSVSVCCVIDNMSRRLPYFRISIQGSADLDDNGALIHNNGCYFCVT
jgi:hypothetical protein